MHAGTANGGSALMWASLQELCGVTGGRVITVSAPLTSANPEHARKGKSMSQPDRCTLAQQG